METIRQTKLVVNTNYVKHNIRTIKSIVGTNVNVMPIIKARSYGTGVATVIDVFTELDIKILGVAVVDEGIALRERGFKGEIVILNQPFEYEIEMMLKYELIPCVCLLSFIGKLNEISRNNDTTSKMHLEIDTGMGRTGINPKDINQYIDKIKESHNIQLDGVSTHFSSSDTDSEYTEYQIKEFDRALDKIQKEFELKYIHAANTAGIINFKHAHYNLVRPGIAIYGYLPNKNLKDKINLLPSTVLKSKVSFIKEVESGTYISYNKTYKTEKTTKIATVPIGYADGIRRVDGQKVVIDGKYANVVGTVCMDSMMVDVTDFEDIEIGQDVYIWDNENITLEDIAKQYNTINYEVLSGLTPRVVKEFI